MQTVYVPVSIETTPENQKDVFAIHDKDGWQSECYIGIDGKWYNTWDQPDPVECFPTHWLKPTEAVLLSKEDAEKIKSVLQMVIKNNSENDAEISIFNIYEFEKLEQALQLLNK